MGDLKLLGVKIGPRSKQYILEYIKKYIDRPQGSLQVVSLNPENIIVAGEQPEFKRAIESSQTQIADGIGVVLAGKIYGQDWERFTGVDLMQELINLAEKLSLRVLLIGGRQNLALELAKCYSQTHAQAKFKGIQAIENIKKPGKSEEDTLFSIVADYKPHIILVSFGSPDQELWLDRHSKKLTGIVTAGVGGAFDYLGGKIRRAPGFLRIIGLEWLFRLVREPWRWRRQLRLLRFAWLVFIEKIKSSF